jgi:hypothetical protein
MGSNSKFSPNEREAAIAVLLENARYCETRSLPICAEGLRARAERIRGGDRIDVDLLHAAHRRMGIEAPAYVNPDARRT